MGVLEKLSAEPRYWALARARIAELRHRAGDTTGAFKTIEEVLEREPGFAGARLVRGRLLLANVLARGLLLRGELDRALAVTRRLAEMWPADPAVRNQVG
jgi:hypothetical protein